MGLMDTLLSSSFFVVDWELAIADIAFVLTFLNLYWLKIFYDWQNPKFKQLVNSFILFVSIAILYVPFMIFVTKVSFMIIVNYSILCIIAISQIVHYHNYKKDGSARKQVTR